MGDHAQVNIHVHDVSITVEADTPEGTADDVQLVGAHMAAIFEREFELPFDQQELDQQDPIHLQIYARSQVTPPSYELADRYKGALPSRVCQFGDS